MGKDRRAPRKAALQRVFEIEQTQIVLASLADDNPGAALGVIGIESAGFGIELALQRLGKGRNPDRAIGGARPQAGRAQITERLADPGSSFRQEQIGLVAALSGGKGGGHGGGVVALTLTAFGS